MNRIRRVRRILPAAVAGVATLGIALAMTTGPGAAEVDPALGGARVQYNVLVARDGSVAAAEDAVRDNGGTVVRSNADIGLMTVTAPRRGFLQRLDRVSAIAQAAPVTVVGRTPGSEGQAKDAVEKEAWTAQVAPAAAEAAQVPAGGDPLDGQLWGMADIQAPEAHAVQPGDPRVTVGIIDVGVDGSHPDIAPNFDAGLSRNFVTDIPTDDNGNTIDGPCEHPDCVDPVDEDDNGHGTHVAGTVGAALNGIGVSGVAPDVTLVNIRAGQDSGYFFLQPTVDALTYAGRAGIDVVNMSFYVDPWLYNCRANPADSPAQQAEQRLIITAMTRAIAFANNHGVTEVVAMGNEHSDLGAPPTDTSSPDYPVGAAYDRAIDDADCLSLPAEAGPKVVDVASYGPSLTKADYSNYGRQHPKVSAPGGWFRDKIGTPDYRTLANEILSAYPQNVGVADGTIDPVTGDITEQGQVVGIQKDCDPADPTVCGYYQSIQGTSMAAPHAAGVAALIVSQYGSDTGSGFGLAPSTVRSVLRGTATDTPCPRPRLRSYAAEGRDASFDALCLGGKDNNGFYGAGRVNALTAVTAGGPFIP